LQKFAAITQPNGDMAQISFFIDESGNPNFYAKRKRPLWIESEIFRDASEVGRRILLCGDRA